jgi:hypothetical protein
MFFVSYSSADGLGGYIHKLFSDLDQKVAQLLGIGATSGAFIDRRSIRTGEDWEKIISASLRNVKVFVCIYSPNYFRVQSREPNYCAKELFSFVRRYSSKSPFDEVDGIKRLTDPQNLFPILWVGASDLIGMGLPPPILKTIEYHLSGLDNPKLADKYLKDGLEPLLRSNRPAYRSILTAIGRQIRDRIKSGKEPPEVNDLAWSESEDSFYFNGTTTTTLTLIGSVGHNTIRAKLEDNLGPRHLLLINFYRNRSSKLNDTIAFLYECAASARYVVTSLSFDQDDKNFAYELNWTLTEASRANWSVVILLEPDVYNRWENSEISATLLTSAWLGGLLIWNQGDATLRQDIRSNLLAASGGRICLREVADHTQETLRSDFLGLLGDIAQRLLASGQVFRERPDNDGPERRPTLVNTAGRPND